MPAYGTVIETRPKSHHYVTRFRRLSRTLETMRCAFVVRLGSETKPSEGRFEGCVEEVDTGRELKFRSNTELLTFLGERFEAGLATELEIAKEPSAGLGDADKT